MTVNGYVLYQGGSLIDGAPIVVIATGIRANSENVKTGAMIQTYILRSGVSPVVAVKTGADASICGDCLHRGDGTGAGRTCYVNVGQGPGSVFRAFQAGKYPQILPEQFAAIFGDRLVRFGAYGDPAAAPFYVWQSISYHAKGWTGYTHQWRSTPALKPYCMASVDSPSEAAEARDAGWRTFRVALPGDLPIMQRESICPASAEAGKKLKCFECMACGGGDRRGSIVIKAHGGFAVMANVKRLEPA